MTLFNYNSEEEMTNGIYLFIPEIIKLLKYINTRFPVTMDRGFSYRAIVTNIGSDEFF